MPWDGRECYPRRTFLRLAGYGGLTLLGASLWPRRGWAAVDPAAVSRMEIEVCYRTEVKGLPRDATRLHLWMPLPPTSPSQEVHDLTVRSSLPYEMREEALFHNRMVHVESGREPASFTVEARYRVVRHRAAAEPVARAEASAPRYLRLGGRMRLTPEIEAFARHAIGGATDPTQVARRVYDALIDTLTYDKQIAGCGTGDTAWIMKSRRGKCSDYHALYATILRGRGIPVRWEEGFPLPYPSAGAVAEGTLAGDCTGAHCWVSFFDPARGWVPVDVSEGDNHPELRDFFFGQLTANRFQISEGRSITLSPAQGGEPLPELAFAYVEADSIPLIYPANYENFVQFRVVGMETA
ncbi:MAG: hypothetical protein COW73_09770 [Nitrospirae bacterium CG18_big_fil_WC_8_21_14_2_50_70_55]|nr:transglutaminase domain-containing protein [Deltaproteobacteria bacterium]OIP62707.1 MAG: hypothetical protein AUK30_09795 [Nitrospirae bacterium CG2_30_70_394]PIQ03819.1 MAG: hypothetical protein COW73_09770 [Nitrospirae bacterium CG18_big_fil_WC_8_21_14_2_50_70_55]PIU80177.1 MAG: hypothetical protein COS73_00800 [Nitrospirae bacterium CG06_land_8_20_14_3_00_70_43]PIW83351.1 MAG: hypothetical protein COZ96_03925 [Nitrospirae bacterium CG_4_8_14_3_um_filter_70_85]PJB95584.1 MAG: hypothetica